MKKIIALLLPIMCVFSLSACDSEVKNANGKSESDSAGFSSSDLYIIYNNTDYKVNEEVDKVKSALGEPTHTISQTSCFYSENGNEYWFDYCFENSTYDTNADEFNNVLRVHTVPLKAGKNYICDFDCYTNLATTSKGITIGNTFEDVVNAYGDGYVDEGDGYYTYYDGEATPTTPKLMFHIVDDKVSFFSVSAATNIQ